MERHTPNMRLKFLQQNIRWDFGDNIGDEEYRQCGIVLISRLNIQLFLQSQNRGITNVHTI